MKYDFVAIGDITTDAFIKLVDAEVNVIHNTRELCLRFGDKVPFESMTEVRAVGNAANAAVAAHRIGLSAALIARIGTDENGDHCLDTLVKQGVATEYVERQAEYPTNYHYVLMFGPERTILVKQAAFTYTLPTWTQEDAPRYIYLTSLAESAKDFHHEVARFCHEHPETKLVFQPGTFQIKLGKEQLADVYAVTEIFFCNKEEAQTILGTETTDIKELLGGIHAIGPRIVYITDGPNGSHVLDSDGVWHVPMYPDPAPPVSRTGAGDATSSTTVSYIAKGLSPHDALLRGAINSASVVQGIGAQTKLLTDTEIQEWFERRPQLFSARHLS